MTTDPKRTEMTSTNETTPDPADQQIATIKTHFTHRVDTLKARAERAERERDDFQDQLGDMRASLSATEAEVDRLRADHPQGYAEAVARLRDDARYTDWWMSGDCEPDGRIRWHLADYLEAVGPDGIDVTTGTWPARERVAAVVAAERQRIADWLLAMDANPNAFADWKARHALTYPYVGMALRALAADLTSGEPIPGLDTTPASVSR